MINKSLSLSFAFCGCVSRNVCTLWLIISVRTAEQQKRSEPIGNGSEPQVGRDTAWLSPSPNLAQGSGNNLKSKCLSLLPLPSSSVVCDYVLGSQQYVKCAPGALCLARQPLMCGLIPSPLAQGCSGCLQVVCTRSKCAYVCVNVVTSVQRPPV